MSLRFGRLFGFAVLAFSLSACRIVSQEQFEQEKEQKTTVSGPIAATYQPEGTAFGQTAGTVMIYNDLDAAGLLTDAVLADIALAQELAAEYIDGTGEDRENAVTMYLILKNRDFFRKNSVLAVQYPQAVREAILHSADKDTTDTADKQLVVLGHLIGKVVALENSAISLTETYLGAVAAENAPSTELADILKRTADAANAERKKVTDVIDPNIVLMQQAAPRLLSYYADLNKDIATLVKEFLEIAPKKAPPKNLPFVRIA